MKERTLLFLYKPNEKQILLAMKKRGFGEGKWNGGRSRSRVLDMSVQTLAP